MTEFLIRNGANVNVCDSLNFGTPLHYAVIFNDIEITKLLIQNGAEMNAKMPLSIPAGLTPFMIAMLKGLENMAKILIQNGASTSIKTEDGHSPLEAALEFKINRSLKFFIYAKF